MSAPAQILVAMADEDLLDSLYSTGEGTVPRQDYEQLASSLQEARKTLESLEADNRKRKRQNAVLLRNLGQLFKTATAELDRKDALLKDAESRIEEMVLRDRRREEKRRRADVPDAPPAPSTPKAEVQVTLKEKEQVEDRLRWYSGGGDAPSPAMGSRVPPGQPASASAASSSNAENLSVASPPPRVLPPPVPGWEQPTALSVFSQRRKRALDEKKHLWGVTGRRTNGATGSPPQAAPTPP